MRIDDRPPTRSRARRAARSPLALLLASLLLATFGAPQAITAQTGTTPPPALAAQWRAADVNDTRSVAWGDVDQDGKLDLAAGNSRWLGDLQPARLYGNAGGTPTSEPIWTSDEVGSIQSVAWANVDGDSQRHLDLVTGDYEGPVRVYLNNPGGRDGPLHTTRDWEAPPIDPKDPNFTQTRSVALADLDGDGLPELTVGYEGNRTRVYLNQSAPEIVDFTEAFSTTESNESFSVAWSSVFTPTNGTRIKLLAVGNNGQPTRVYRNDSTPGAIKLTLVYSTPTSASTRSVAWADLDRDGRPDLVVGNEGAPTRVYRNTSTAGGVSFALAYSTPVSESTKSVALADYDRDGDPDLAVGNAGQPNRLYRNDSTPGTIVLTPVWVDIGTTSTWSLAWGDVDGDGYPDLAAGNSSRNSQVYKNIVPNPKVQVLQIGKPVPDALAYYRPAGAEGAFVPYTGFIGRSTDNQGYLIAAPLRQGDTVVAASRVISSTWVTTDTNSVPQAISDAGPSTITSTITVAQDGAVHDVNIYNLNGTHSWVGDLTFTLESPQGTQVTLLSHPCNKSQYANFKINLDDEAGTAPAPCPLIDATGSYRPASPLSAFDGEETGGIWKLIVNDSYTGDGGSLNGWSLVIDRSPYSIYNTNATPTPTGLAPYTVTAALNQATTVAKTNPLLLFDLNVSLEWDAHKDTGYMSQLRYDLQRTSELLYDWTNGQVALGSIRVYQNREQWDSADVQIYATNRLRPNADQGGISTTIYTDTIALPGGRTTKNVYSPGHVRIGAVWNRYGSVDGIIGEDWPRTLAHELSHYLLYLDDNYVGFNGNQPVTIPESSCHGAMNNPYRDEETEFHPSLGWASGCAQTLSNLNTRRADWETIKKFYPALNAPAPTVDFAHLNPGPSNLPLPVTEIVTRSIGTSSATLAVPIFNLIDAATQGRAVLTPSARAFLFQDDRLIDLGRPVLDQVQARGARPGDVLCAYGQFYGQTTRRAGCERVSAGDSRLALASQPAWAPDVIVTPLSTHDIAVAVKNVQARPLLKAQLYPVSGERLATIALTSGAAGYTGQFLNLPARLVEGYLLIWNDANNNNLLDPAEQEMIVTDYVVAGDPPPSAAADAIVPDSHKSCSKGNCPKKKSNAPVFSNDGQASLLIDSLDLGAGKFYSIQSATALPPAAPWTVAIGQGYRLVAPTATIPITTPIGISYLQSELPAGTEGGVGIYFWDTARSQWRRLPTTRLDTERHEINATNAGPGLYTAMTSINVRTGWNLVSYPWPRSSPVRDALRLLNADGAYTTVYGHVVSGTLDTWRVYDIDAPDWVNDLKQIEYGQGYWINVTTAPGQSARPAGTQPAAADLSTPPATYYGAAPAAGLTVRGVINGNICGSSTTSTQTLDGRQTPAFAIKVLAAGVGAAGCGTPGQPFSIEFLSGTTVVKTIALRWDNNRVHRVVQLYLPVAVGSATTPPGPNLTVIGVTVLPAAPRADQPAELRVTIRNTGSANITTPFWVDLYVDPRSAPQVNQIWPRLSAFGASWRVYGLLAGETRTLSTLAPNDPLDPNSNYSNFQTFVGAGAHQIYALVDSYAPNQPGGAIAEADERDNVLGPLGVAVSAGASAAPTGKPAPIDARPSQ